MPIEIACGSCGNLFGVVADWAGLIVQCPSCSAKVQVPHEVAAFAEESAPVPTRTLVPTPPELIVSNDDPPAHAPNVPEAKTRPPRTRSADRFKRAESKPRRSDRNESSQPPQERRSSSDRKNRVPPTKRPRVDRDFANIALADTKPAGLDDLPPFPKPAATTLLPPLVVRVEPIIAATPPPLPPWTSPPVCEWLQDSNAPMAIQVVAREGLTTIQYHGRKLVLRDQPEAATWYGRISFMISAAVLVALLTWLYYVYL